MAKGKRGGHRKPQQVIAAQVMQHHDFVGQAQPERQEARQRKEEHVQRDHEKVEAQVVREMERELEREAGLAPEPAPQPAAQQRKEAPRSAPGADRPRTAVGAGIQFLREARQNAPAALEKLRSKAEERLASLPRPVKLVMHRTEQAAALLLAPVRIGAALAREVLRAPLNILNLRRQEKT